MKIVIGKKSIELNQIKSYRHGVFYGNNRQFLELKLIDGSTIKAFNIHTFDPIGVVELLHSQDAVGVCPSCGQPNKDNWPIRVGSVVLYGGCQACWEAESNE